MWVYPLLPACVGFGALLGGDRDRATGVKRMTRFGLITWSFVPRLLAHQWTLAKHWKNSPSLRWHRQSTLVAKDPLNPLEVALWRRGVHWIHSWPVTKLIEEALNGICSQGRATAARESKPMQTKSTFKFPRICKYSLQKPKRKIVSWSSSYDVLVPVCVCVCSLVNLLGFSRPRCVDN